jgi:hypothetical protein
MPNGIYLDIASFAFKASHNLHMEGTYTRLPLYGIMVLYGTLCHIVVQTGFLLVPLVAVAEEEMNLQLKPC